MSKKKIDSKIIPQQDLKLWEENLIYIVEVLDEWILKEVTLHGYDSVDEMRAHRQECLKSLDKLNKA